MIGIAVALHSEQPRAVAQPRASRAALARRLVIGSVPTHSLDALVTRSVGRFATGGGFIAWCAMPALCGLVLWGPLTRGGVDALIRTFDRGEAGGVPAPCDFVLDARRLTGCEPAAYDELAAAIKSRASELRHRVKRQAIVRGCGLLGAAVSGFYAAIDVELAARSFGELALALAWLDRGCDGLATRIEALTVEIVSGSIVVEQLRGWLQTHGDRRATIDEPARALGLSTRSLQRELNRSATSFRVEVERARLATAQQLLQHTDLKIAAIATRIGMSNEASFSTFFRRVMQLSPAEWRVRHRASHALTADQGSLA